MNRPFAAFALFALAGCGMALPPSQPYMKSNEALLTLNATGAGKIQHIVYIVQENRSFNDLFQGYPNAYTVPSGKDSKGQTVALKPVSLHWAFDIDHSAGAMFAACNGTGKLPGTKCRMNGFDLEQASGVPHVKYPQYTYVPHSDSKPYFEMAHEWVLADKMFQSQVDESFVAHQYIIAAQANTAVDLPYGAWGCDAGSGDTVSTLTPNRHYGPTESPCFDYETLGDELDKAKLSWRFYASKYGGLSSRGGGFWSSYQAINHIRNGPDWTKDVISPQKRILTDVHRGKLADFTWVTPICSDSDHTGCGGGYGPSWVAAIVNAVGKSKFWDSTAIFVQWDDWGGLYDPVPPPFKNFDGLGFRVPLLVISPYAKKDYVSHKQYETASVLRFAEDLFGLKQLAGADTRALSPAGDCFDFSQKPRAFIPIKAPKGVKFFLDQPDEYQAPDYE